MQRFTISLDDSLAEAFDAWIAQRQYANRSEAVRDLLRAELDKAHIEEAAHSDCVACLSYVYDHHQRDLAERLITLQHDHHDLTLCTMHAHLDHDSCLETVLLRGDTAAVRSFSDALIAERGVRHGKLNMISVETEQTPHAQPKAHLHSHAQPHTHSKPRR